MGVTCPHCEYEHDEMDEPSAFPWTDESEPEFNCWGCGEKFWIETVTFITWYTHATEDEYEMR